MRFCCTYIVHWGFQLHVYSHTIPCCQITMNKLLLSKIFHALTDLMTHIQTHFSCSLYLCKNMECVNGQMTRKYMYVCTSTSVASWLRYNCFLFFFTNPKTLPLAMNGIMSRGISPSKHNPMREHHIGMCEGEHGGHFFEQFLLLTCS